MKHLLGDVLRDWLERTELASRSRAAEVILRWPAIAGPEISRHCRAASLKEGELTVIVDHKPNFNANEWALELSLLTPKFLERIESELGEGIVTKIRFAVGWRNREQPGLKSRGPMEDAPVWPAERDLAAIPLSREERALLDSFTEKVDDPDLAKAGRRWLETTLRAKRWLRARRWLEKKG